MSEYSYADFNASLNTLAAHFRSFGEIVQATTTSINAFAQALKAAQLPVREGEWPDKFVVLNRYLRTGVEPEYFSGKGNWF